MFWVGHGGRIAKEKQIPCWNDNFKMMTEVGLSLRSGWQFCGVDLELFDDFGDYVVVVAFGDFAAVEGAWD